MKAVVTVVGKDKKGIIARVSGVLFENDINILDISQTIMQDMFTMIMLVDLEGSELAVKQLTDKLHIIETDMDLSIHVQREEIFDSMHRI